MSKKMTITFDSSSADHYAWTHGHRPRGYGGGWLFDVTYYKATSSATHTVQTPSLRGTFTEVKRLAVAWARDNAPEGADLAYFSVCT